MQPEDCMNQEHRHGRWKWRAKGTWAGLRFQIERREVTPKVEQHYDFVSFVV